MPTLAEAAGNMAEYTHDAEETFLSQCIHDPMTGYDLAVRHRLSSHSFAYATHSCVFANLMAAAEAGMQPRAFCDMIVEHFKSAWKSLDIAESDFIRTTDKRHLDGVEKVFPVHVPARLPVPVASRAIRTLPGGAGR